jgi:hypothetical protein
MPARKKPSLREEVSRAQEDCTTGKQAIAPLEMNMVGTGMNLGICRTQILGKYWELANLGPEATKGNIAGQLKALDSLCQELDVVLPESARPNNQRNKENEIYRSAWMRPDKATDAADDQ